MPQSLLIPFLEGMGYRIHKPSSECRISPLSSIECKIRMLGLSITFHRLPLSPQRLDDFAPDTVLQTLAFFAGDIGAF